MTFQCVSTSLYITVAISREIPQHTSAVLQICLSAWLYVLFKQTTHPDEQFNILSHRCHIKNVLFCEVLRITQCIKNVSSCPYLSIFMKNRFQHFIISYFLYECGCMLHNTCLIWFSYEIYSGNSCKCIIYSLFVQVKESHYISILYSCFA